MSELSAALLTIAILGAASILSGAWRDQTTFRREQLRWEQQRFSKERRG